MMSKAETKTERKPETKVEKKPEVKEGEIQRREVVEWYEVFDKNLVYMMYGKAGVGKTRLAV